jgi:hypothetical protein
MIVSPLIALLAIFTIGACIARASELDRRKDEES